MSSIRLASALAGFVGPQKYADKNRSGLFGRRIDGDVSSSSTAFNINTGLAGPGSGGRSVDAPKVAVTAIGTNTVTTSGSLTDFRNGDVCLLINLKGSSTRFSRVGTWERVRIASMAGAIVTLTDDVAKLYGETGGGSPTNSDLTGQVIMLLRIPEYGTVTLSGTASLSASAFDGATGGVVAFMCRTLNVAAPASITAQGIGFRGVAGAVGESTAGSTNASGLGPTGTAGTNTITGFGGERNGAGGGGGGSAGGGGGYRASGSIGSYGGGGGGGGGQGTVAPDSIGTPGGAGSGATGGTSPNFPAPATPGGPGGNPGGAGGASYGQDSSDTAGNLFFGGAGAGSVAGGPGGNGSGAAGPGGAGGNGTTVAGGAGGGIVLVWAETTTSSRIIVNGAAGTTGATGTTGGPNSAPTVFGTGAGGGGSGGGGGGAAGTGVLVSASIAAIGPTTATGGAGGPGGPGGPGGTQVFFNPTAAGGVGGTGATGGLGGAGAAGSLVVRTFSPTFATTPDAIGGYAPLAAAFKGTL